MISFHLSTRMANFLRISGLEWADLLATFTMYMMMSYLKNVWNLSITHAAAIINIWNGSKPVLALVFAFFVDVFAGHFYMLLSSSIAYCIGLGLLSMSTPGVFGPCHHDNYRAECIEQTQKVLFYTALSLIAVGKAGREISLPQYSELDKRKQTEPENVNKYDEPKTCFQQLIKSFLPRIWKIVVWVRKIKKKIYYYTVELPRKFSMKLIFCTIAMVIQIYGDELLPYIKPWSVRFGISAICFVVAMLFFITGIQEYERKEPTGSPLITAIKVFVASARKIFQPTPNPEDLYKEDNTRSTNTLTCFDKAAIILTGEQQSKSWKLCSVREVEDTKTCIRMIPSWLTFIVIGIVRSTGTTYFLEQADRMDPKLGKLKVSVPIFLSFYFATTHLSERLYTKYEEYISPVPKKYVPPLGIATSMVFCVLCCITAAKVETRRLHLIRDHSLLDKPKEIIPMSVFELLPQFMLLAVVKGIANKSISGFFRDQTPESMGKHLTYFTDGVFGLGRMASVLLVYVVGKVSDQRNNKNPNWFQNTLNRSRLDRYYWVLAGLSAANLIAYAIVAYAFKYKKPVRESGDHATKDDETYELRS